MNIIENFIYTKKLNLNIPVLQESAIKMNDFISEHFSNSTNAHDIRLALSSRMFREYNMLLYPFDQFHELYHEIRNTFFEIIGKSDKKYYLGSWLNYYKKNNSFPWHEHNDWEWHGFVCIDSEGSHTTYKLPDGQVVDIPNENGLLVISKTKDAPHRTWPWPHEDKPRITMAFDIGLHTSVNIPEWKNHWIPL